MVRRTKENHISSPPVDLIISSISFFALKIHLFGRMEKWKIRIYFSFSYLRLVRRVEKSRDGRLFCMVEIKNERTENRVCIDLQSCPYLIKQKVTHYILFFFLIVYRWALQ